jgi:hypothetical protein
VHICNKFKDGDEKYIKNSIFEMCPSIVFIINVNEKERERVMKKENIIFMPCNFYCISFFPPRWVSHWVLNFICTYFLLFSNENIFSEKLETSFFLYFNLTQLQLNKLVINLFRTVRKSCYAVNVHCWCIINSILW